MSRLSKEETLECIAKITESARKRLNPENQMDMDMFYMIFTQSNELIHVVDCRSKEEYETSHIAQAFTLEEFHSHTEWKGLRIRTFFYSRIGERSAKVVEEELKNGVCAVNMNGGFIAWLHKNGYVDFKDGYKANMVRIVDKEYGKYLPADYKDEFE